MRDFYRLQDIHETLLLSQLTYWQDSDRSRWHYEHESAIWLKIDLSQLLELFPWLTRSVLKQKISSLVQRGDLEKIKIKGFNIYQITYGDKLMPNNRGTTIWVGLESDPSRVMGQPTYLYIIYNIYINTVAESIFTDRKNVDYEQIRTFYYTLAKTIINVKCGSKATAIQRLKRLSNRQLDDIIESISLHAISKWYTYNDDFKQKFKQFEAWLSLYLKTDEYVLLDEREEINQLLQHATMPNTVFEFWQSKITIPQEVINEHYSKISKGTFRPTAKGKKLHNELDAITNYQPANLLSEETD